MINLSLNISSWSEFGIFILTVLALIAIYFAKRFIDYRFTHELTRNDKIAQEVYLKILGKTSGTHIGDMHTNDLTRSYLHVKAVLEKGRALSKEELKNLWSKDRKVGE